MTAVWKEKKTKETKVIERVLKENFPRYPKQYPPAAYRYNRASIRVRVVDESFSGKDRVEREEMVLPLIRQLPKETQDDITILLLLAPEDVDKSWMNREFEHPTPSRI